MGAGCGGGSCSTQFDGASRAFKRALLIVIAINGVMFIIEMLAGFKGQSMALKADALDFFGDTVSYAISLWAIGKSGLVRANVAMAKGISLVLMGVFVLGATLYRFFVLGAPDEQIMGVIGTMALVANLASVVVLMNYRDGDANVRSVWLCSRNDAIGNLAVLGAALAVYFSQTPWPDLIVAALMATLFLNSARQIITQARHEIAHEKEAGRKKNTLSTFQDPHADNG
ncbi:MAG: cation transporter [Hyphomicrobiaceae bacterium]|nr:cation transporter [Hyphomicrobiaceae bacterium]